MPHPMFELPLFPLNSVLFPGTLINLHIFKDRYKQMINLCLQTQQPFGVVLIAEGREAFGPAQPHMVGCTAKIIRMQPLDQGRMDISAVGQERFEIQSLQHDRPYLVGLVELRPLVRDNDDLLIKASARLRPLVMQYVNILSRLENVQFNLPDLPADPVAFAYLAAAVLQQVPQTAKQDLLNSKRALDLYNTIHTLYQFEVTLLTRMAERAENKAAPGSNISFSDN